METFETKIIPIYEVDRSEPKSVLVKVFKITVDETSEKEEKKELYKTIEYFPKRIKRKPKYNEEG